MNDANLVRGLEGFGDLPRDRQRVTWRHRSARDEHRQVVALDELYHERAHPAGFVDAEDLRDVRVIERRERLGFAYEARQPVGVLRKRLGQHLDRDIPIERRVARAIHLAHAACADGSEDFVRAEAGTGSEGHR